jgi:alkylation response protein AidB-like acyl-CoA dehydrogenase
MTWRAAVAKDNGENYGPLAAMAKLFASEMCNDVPELAYSSWADTAIPENIRLNV